MPMARPQITNLHGFKQASIDAGKMPAPTETQTETQAEIPTEIPTEIPRVRINLNLERPNDGSSSMRVVTMHASGRQTTKHVAWPKFVHLRNVRPVVNQTLRQKLVEKKIPHKTPYIASLEGDLIAWSGQPNPKAQDTAQWESVEGLCVDEDAFYEKIQRAFGPHSRWTPIGFNPKKTAVFHDARQSWPDITRAFVSARELVSAGWFYKAHGVTTRPVTSGEVETRVAEISEHEKERMKAGLQTTKSIIDNALNIKLCA